MSPLSSVIPPRHSRKLARGHQRGHVPDDTTAGLRRVFRCTKPGRAVLLEGSVADGTRTAGRLHRNYLAREVSEVALGPVSASDSNAVAVRGSDLEVSCSVSDRVAGRETLLPPCRAPDQKDCFWLDQDAARCPLWLAPQGVNLIVERSRPAAPETVTELACQQAEE